MTAWLTCAACSHRANRLPHETALGTVSAPPEAGLPKPFRQDIPGAAFDFELCPIPGSADGSIAPFFIGTTELTWEAFDVFIYRLDEQAATPPPSTPAPTPTPDAVTRPSKPYLPPDRGFGHEGFAAISMSHKTATEFCAWLSLRSGRKYRLPTEAEWEHACRAGAAGAYCFGDDPTLLPAHAWFADNALATPHQVATRKPNAWGLFDTHGNVAEWCNAADGTPVARGGSYLDPAAALTAASRRLPDRSWNASDPQVPKSKWWLADAPFVGFRAVCESVPESK